MDLRGVLLVLAAGMTLAGSFVFVDGQEVRGVFCLIVAVLFVQFAELKRP